jgi:acetyl-CoA acyltransferase
MGEAYIISAVRTPVGKAYKGSLRHTRPDEMAAVVIAEAVNRVPGLEASRVDDVVMGCAMPEGEQGLNVARISLLRAGFPVEVPGMTLNRFCSSGLEAINYAAAMIATGRVGVAVAGGVESMSLVPMGGNKPSPNPHLVDEYPEVFIGMGLTAERVAEEYGVTRDAQDRFSLESHQKAVQAIREKRFEKETVPLDVMERSVNAAGRIEERRFTFAVDEGPRADTSLEALAGLKPAFKQDGTVTAGNSSQMSDGAAALVLAGEAAVKKLGVEPLARFAGYATAGLDPALMGMGPVFAVPRVLEKTGVKLSDIDIIELNEAFAAQGLAVIQELGLPADRVNVSGGAIALGHPLGCTGAKLACTILHELKRRSARYGLVTMCIGGGMGAAGLFERI